MLYAARAVVVTLGLALTLQSAAAQSDMPAMDAGAHHGAMTVMPVGTTPSQPGVPSCAFAGWTCE